jgi:hypothetical protein
MKHPKTAARLMTSTVGAVVPSCGQGASAWKNQEHDSTTGSLALAPVQDTFRCSSALSVGWSDDERAWRRAYFERAWHRGRVSRPITPTLPTATVSQVPVHQPLASLLSSREALSYPLWSKYSSKARFAPSLRQVELNRLRCRCAART